MSPVHRSRTRTVPCRLIHSDCMKGKSEGPLSRPGLISSKILFWPTSLKDKLQILTHIPPFWVSRLPVLDLMPQAFTKTFLHSAQHRFISMLISQHRHLYGSIESAGCKLLD